MNSFDSPYPSPTLHHYYCLNQNSQNYRMNRIKFHPILKILKFCFRHLVALRRKHAPNAPYACYLADSIPDRIISVTEIARLRKRSPWPV